MATFRAVTERTFTTWSRPDRCGTWPPSLAFPTWDLPRPVRAMQFRRPRVATGPASRLGRRLSANRSPGLRATTRPLRSSRRHPGSRRPRRRFWPKDGSKIFRLKRIGFGLGVDRIDEWPPLLDRATISLPGRCRSTDLRSGGEDSFAWSANGHRLSPRTRARST